jgi:AhpC/TSA family
MVEEGKPAPDFELTSDSGERVKLSDFRGRPVVLYFYPKDDTLAEYKQYPVRFASSEASRRWPADADNSAESRAAQKASEAVGALQQKDTG